MTQPLDRSDCCAEVRRKIGIGILPDQSEVAMERKRVGIVIYEDVEVLDFCGPFEVFSVSRLDEAKRREETSPFQRPYPDQDARRIQL
jgi:hypothetical protein